MDGQGSTSIVAGAIHEMTPAQKREQVIRAQTIAGIHTDRYVADHPERAWRGTAAFRIASLFDPIRETAEHCAALLFYLGLGDGKWLYCSGVSMDVVFLVQEAEAAFGAAHGFHPQGGSWDGQATRADEPDNDGVDAWWRQREEFFAKFLMSRARRPAARIGDI